MTLTGKLRHRNFFGKCVLQVEYIKMTGTDIGEYKKVWRDARVEDLSELTALVFSKIDVYLPQVPEFSEEVVRGTRKAN